MSDEDDRTDELAPRPEESDLLGATEALLFVSDEPLSPARLAQMLEVSAGRASELLQALADQYERGGRGVQLRQTAGGWRLYTHPAYHELIERYVLSWDTRKLSQAALEALAVIAYSQPVTRAGVNAIRGVNSEGVISSLIEKGLVREVGRDSAPGSPILYGTTTSFLEKFGLASVSDLPPLEEFAPDEETRELIRERLSGDVPAEGAPQAAGQEEPDTAVATETAWALDADAVSEDAEAPEDALDGFFEDLEDEDRG